MITHFLRLLFLFTFPSLLFSNEASLIAGHLQNNCFEGEKFFPDGKTVAIGSRTFLYCGSSAFQSSGSLLVQKERRIDHELDRKHSNISYSGLIQQKSYQRGHPYGLTGNVVGVHYFGDHKYQLTIADYQKPDFETASKQGKSYIGHMLFHAPETKISPEHYLMCDKPPIDPSLASYHCNLTVVYNRSEGIYISQKIIRNEALGLKGMDFEELPDHAFLLKTLYSLLELPE